MLNENHNNQDWRSRLEDPVGLADDCMADKNAAWEKLQARLQPGKQPSKRWWLWIAAACLLGAIVIPFFTQKPAPSIATKTTPKRSIIEKTGPPSASRETIFVATPPITNFRREARDDQKIRPASLSHQKIKVQPALEMQPTPLQEPIVFQPVLNIPVAANAVSVSPRKNLRVVHINELGDTTPDAYPLARVEDRGYIRIQLVNQANFTNPPSMVNSPGFNIFKSKNAPSN